MPSTHYNATGDLLRDLAMPLGWSEHFRTLLARIEAADTPINCLLAQERAEGVVEGLELAKAREAAIIERLYVLVAEVAAARLLQLQPDPGGR
ncbi:hypothetical protein AB9U01_25200 [Pseudomonas qingdaonensis]|uniref:hypothetical protein n=1 Tax=Pseudomonas qingdaonensis TaxID=2056231 RepID=UPI003519034E